MNDTWHLQYEGFDQKEHPLQEALCTLGNGYMATRGALEMERNFIKSKPDKEGKNWNYPGTYLAGGYNRSKSMVQDREIENEDLVNWPNWLFLNYKPKDGNWLDLEKVEIISFETHLYLKTGILQRNMRFKDEQGRITSIVSKRFMSMDNPHIAALQWTFIPENWSGEVIFRTAIDGDIINNNVARYSDLNQNHIEVIDKKHVSDQKMYMISQSRQSKIVVAQVSRIAFFVNGEGLKIETGNFFDQNNFLGADFEFTCKAKNEYVLEKIVAQYTSRDMAISHPLDDALILSKRTTGFDQLQKRHINSWRQLWQFSDIELTTSDDLNQLVTRMHIFHLHQTVSHHSINYDVGIPARGWHGEAYRGHIFWDELYIQPNVDLVNPQLSRSLLMYRYRRLPEARHAARNAGFRGAMFPWQSGSNGREETQTMHLNPKSGRWLPDVSHLQYHINAAIPYNVWHYYQSTGDMDFLLSHGAEIILSTALFWSSITTYNEQRNRYEILKVMGPDEYHTHYPDASDEDAGLNNNAYTNVMAVWVLRHALDLLNLLDEDCCRNLEHNIGYDENDLKRWDDITKRMYVPFKGDVILQFDGYEDLKELDWDHYRGKYGNAMRLDRILEAGGDSCNLYKASKQADVLMLFYLFSSEELKTIFTRLGYDFRAEMIQENIEYYRQRTAHGSTLSEVIHAWVYARSHRDESWRRFREALMSDYRDIQGGTTHEGIHLGAMAGTLDIIKRCYSGLEIRDDVLWLNPRLPDDIHSIAFRLRYRGHWIYLNINHKKLIIDFDKGWSNPVVIGVEGKTHRFETNDKKEFLLQKPQT